MSYQNGVAGFTIHRGDVRLQFHYSRPALGLLLREGPNLHLEMWDVLREFGLDLSNVEINNDTSKLSNPYINYVLPVLFAGVRIHLDRMDVTFLDLSKVQEAMIHTVVAAGLKGLERGVGVNSFSLVQCSLGLHGMIEGIEPDEFIGNRLSARPAGIGDNLGNGIAHYFGTSGPVRRSSITMEPSVVLPDGLFLRLTMDLEGESAPGDGPVGVIHKHSSAMLEAVGLHFSTDSLQFHE